MVTRIEDLKCAAVQEVALPGFVPGELFHVKLRRPSLMRLAQEGEIPNPLLGAAAKLFNEGISGVKDGESFKETSAAVVHLAKASLVEPTYEALESAGITLTDAQLIQIYLYTQKGVQLLDGFREEQTTEPDSQSGKSAGKNTK